MPETDQARLIAERIARRIDTARGSGERGPVSLSVNTSSQPKVPSTHSPWLAGINAPYSHPSEERFGVEEATVSKLVDFFEQEKTCSMEPGAKPCDHCDMCSSRGF